LSTTDIFVESSSECKMKLTGYNIIGIKRTGIGKRTFNAVNPADGSTLEPVFYEADAEEILEAAEKAESAFSVYGRVGGNKRADFLDAIADEIDTFGDPLIDRCCSETALPRPRIEGERGRTTFQLRLFAGLLRDGSWVDARIDTAVQDRKPLPKPDVRSMQTALGPVAVFGSGNFPLAFSTAGGDTTSALAAGCPVIFKAHPAHPGTCELVAIAIQKAAEKTGMPDGTFSLLHGVSHDVGMALITHPAIKAVGFTGSYSGGKAIFDAAVRRPEPIPVYAEMGSVNPVFLLPGALKEKSAETAKGLAASVTLGVGQFCTNPGLILYLRSAESDRFEALLAEEFSGSKAGTMLTSGICSAYRRGIERLEAHTDVRVLASGSEIGSVNAGLPRLLQTTAAAFLSDRSLEREVFGPSTLLVTADNNGELLSAARSLGGHLTAAIHGTENDLHEYSELISLMRLKAGRLIFNGFPTGVEVCHSMVHGGTFPATTDSRMTSVGTRAILRFTRPVSYQNFPDIMLPDELKPDNPLGILRMVDGEMKV
jgi:2,5-dioxopentanoate dehydrogenase